jgi:predicted ferric reductase
LPVFLETLKALEVDGGVEVTGVESIVSSLIGQERQCISLSLMASPEALASFCSGQYIKLTAPTVSCVAHPFTINRLPGNSGNLNIIFRVVGPFTRGLANALLDCDKGVLPAIHIEGYHGSCKRLDQVLRHDVVVLVAGGIGVTPYLSLLDDIFSALKYKATQTTKRVVLHWICPDNELINYIKSKCFNRQTSDGEGFRINIVHQTREAESRAEIELLQEKEMPFLSTGSPWVPSLYSQGHRGRRWVGTFAFFLHCLARAVS